MHLDWRIIWRVHIEKKREPIDIVHRKLNWILRKKSRTDLETKTIIYKAIIKPIWTYGLQLWGSARQTNLQVINRCQTEIIRSILGAPKFISNATILKDMRVNNVKT